MCHHPKGPAYAARMLRHSMLKTLASRDHRQTREWHCPHFAVLGMLYDQCLTLQVNLRPSEHQ